MAKSIDNLKGLGGLDDVLNRVHGSPAPTEKITKIKMSLIEEDPGNARTKFKDMEDFKKSIVEVDGLTTPIVVRESPNKTGHYIISNGHRRYRVYKELGRNEIEAVVNNNFDRTHQLVDNLQRTDYDPFDLANGMKMAMKEQGISQADLSKKLGKSRAYVTHYMALLNLPEILLQAFEEGKIQDVTVAYTLFTAYKEDPDTVTSFLSSVEEVGRRQASSVLKSIKDKVEGGKTDSDESTGDTPPAPMVTNTKDNREEESESDTPSTVVGLQGESTTQLTNAIKDTPKTGKKGLVSVFVSIEKGDGRLILDRTPRPGYAWVIVGSKDGGVVTEVELDKIKITNIE